jgi:hypothetical protein
MRPQTRSSRLRVSVIGSAWLAALALTGCIDRGLTDAVVIVNHTPDTLRFALIAEDGRWFDLMAPATSGTSAIVLSGSQLSDGAGLMRDRCTLGDLIAFDANGHTVARLLPPLCAPGTWVMETGGAVHTPRP